MELCRLLQITTHGGQDYNDYFENAWHCQSVGSCWRAVSDSDLIRYVLNGLGFEFNSFVVTLTTRSEHIFLEELYNFLFSHESLLLSQYQICTSDSIALYASSRGSGHTSCGRSRNFPPSQAAPLLPTLGPSHGGPVSSGFISRGCAAPFNQGPSGSV
jgi:hypothetical protein